MQSMGSNAPPELSTRPNITPPGSITALPCALSASTHPRIIGKMTRAVPLDIADLNGQRNECLAEAFNTPYNIFILLYPIASLTATTVILP